ncbi:hypothetical protein [Paucimonas lemoignei]|uniref:hypothetical protein n=1 Tax=Paucimonas lemoignei TaxID=29443 RepID=UPI00104A3198|nr:hypothetical protein [Paucimonas lemoignei]
MAQEKSDLFKSARQRGEQYVQAEWTRQENLTVDDAANMSSSTAKSIIQRREVGEIYALARPDSEECRYPAWQFRANPFRLAAVLRPLIKAKTNSWVIHNFMLRPSTILGGQTPAEFIGEDFRPIDAAVTAAKLSIRGEEQGAL